MDQTLIDEIARAVPAGAYWRARFHQAREESLLIRRGVLEPVALRHGAGVMIEVEVDGCAGYAATAELTGPGVARAVGHALRAAAAMAARPLPGASAVARLRVSSRPPPAPVRHGAGPLLAERIEYLHATSARVAAPASAGPPARNVTLADWEVALRERRGTVTLCDAAGVRAERADDRFEGSLAVTAAAGDRYQTRTLGADRPRRGGLTDLSDLGLLAAAAEITDQAVALALAPPCPTGRLDLVLGPGQMALQIHESIGHPLELDRILGDERNYAGGSFVTPAMFGTYRYGSALLNVTFDPGVDGEVASYEFDDDGAAAQREHLIRDGLLVRGLGGATSQARSAMAGVACARASDWNRPAIDRMANINIEPGDDTVAALIGRVERGVFMDTNRTWSIDDRRNKFQFGCEYGRMIRDGELAELVSNPGYRGVSASFWRSLAGVGDAASRRLMGTAWCGKGEPNAIVAVGHAAPPCLFRAVEVFGG